jgi:predicted RNA-binding protein with PUA-like domain
MRYWMMKCEPKAYSIEDLKNAPMQTTTWEGVRNYQARNMIRDEIKKGDLSFFYYSNVKTPGVMGIMEITKEGYPDDTAWNPEHKYYDPVSTPDNPRWYQVDVKLVEIFPMVISLSDLRNVPQLMDLWILRKGNRLSVTPVSENHWNEVLSLRNTSLVL